MRILYADDDADEQYFFTEALKLIDKSIECVTANDGAEALWKLSSDSNLNFIFLDLNMPGIDGKESLRAIKNNPKLKEIPVVIYSNAVERSEEMYLLKQGAAKVMHKKWNVAELSSELKKLFAERYSLAKFS
jgi:CheY-like chemotaxis protein